MSSDMDMTVFVALAGAAEAASQRGQDPTRIHEQVVRLASLSDCNTSVRGDVVALGPAVGDVSGTGYRIDCELSAQTQQAWTSASASAAAARVDGAR